jgi:hypothetical protein
MAGPMIPANFCPVPADFFLAGHIHAGHREQVIRNREINLRRDAH